MYHFFSTFTGSAAGASETAPSSAPSAAAPSCESDPMSTGGVLSASESLPSWGVPLSIDQLRQVRPSKVEQPEDHSRHDRHHDHPDRRGAHFLRRRPRDLPELGSDLVGEGVILVASVHHD